ncbi:Biotin--Protein Ligase [Manis pentadactyla]|nr:Biotin--Protein Ligase [Manis pentadactyla]
MARLSFMFTLRHDRRALQLMAAFQGECAIQFQDYSVAKVISMMRLEFQATGPFRVRVMYYKSMGWTGILFDLKFYSDVRAKARLIFIIVVWHR